jgi:putative sugar O-methyltransferase
MKYKGNWVNLATVGERYIWACAKLSKNLANFKANPYYSCVVGNDLRSETVAQSFYTFIKENSPEIFENLKKFTLNDKIGGPNRYCFDNDIIISPGTLRYLRVLHDIIKLNPSSILEIGGGYGGQALITKLFKKNISYSIIDVPEVLMLQKSYLDTILPNHNIDLISTEDIDLKDNYDLILSDYCISEFDSDGVDFYIDIAKNCKFGYFTINSTGDSREYLIRQLKDIFKSVEIFDEDPRTSPHLNIYVVCKK